ncbi:uncharacterized protein LOC110727244 [Chenopodium quinoa]|uniref:uncharacterized protein LOC110727244 n=1 Tax=Chenopodium quinoa TaxID=63459 RepID=UPI000B777E09|nr:uncharacterized protein LOC110727244 [Chenopodium quinoa]
MLRSEGPFEVVERVGPNAYKLKLLGGFGVYSTFNVGDLAPFLFEEYVGDNDPKLRAISFEEDGFDAGARWGYSGKLNAKGAALSFVVPLIKEGKPIAILPTEEIAKNTKKWSNAAVLYVVGFSPLIAAIHRFIAEQWNRIAKPEVYWHDDGYFIVNFCSHVDLNSVLCNGPDMYNGKPIIVKQWSDKFYFSAEVLRNVPLWVRLSNFPLNCWGTETLSKIGSLLGVPICADECTTRKLRVSFARLLMEIDVTKSLPKSVWVESLGGELVELTVEYNWIPPFCEKCKKVGHACVGQQDKPMSYAQQVMKKPQPLQQNTRVLNVAVVTSQAINKPANLDEWQLVKNKRKGVAVSQNVTSNTNQFSVLSESVSGDQGVQASKQRSKRGWAPLDAMIVVTWNMRGLNDPSKVADVKQLLLGTKSDYIFLLETKVKVKKCEAIQKKFVGFTWIANYTASTRGRIWVGWKNDRLHVDVLAVHEHFIHYLISTKDLQTQIAYTFVYGLHSVHDRKRMWAVIQSLGVIPIPWLCAGDFNAILDDEDKINGNPISAYETKDFQKFIGNMELVEIKSKGSYYSWSNKARNGPRVYSRIDRGLINAAWLTQYRNVEAIYLAPSLSDHTPVLYEVFPSSTGKGKPFKFLNCLLSHVDFQITIEDAWRKEASGGAMLRWNKLKTIKEKLKR